MRAITSRRIRRVAVAALAVCLCGARGSEFVGPLLRHLSVRLARLLIDLGIVNPGTMVHFGLILLGVFALIATFCAALGFREMELDYAHDQNPNGLWPHRGRRRCGTAFVLLCGLLCTGLIFGGSVPERSHWVGAGVTGAIGIGLAVAALSSWTVTYRLLFAALAIGAFAWAGHWLRVPPTDEAVAAKRLDRQGFETDWNDVNGESHVTEVVIQNGEYDHLHGAELENVVADLKRLGHLKKVSCLFGAKQIPGAAYARLDAALPGVEIERDFQQRLRDIQRREWRFGDPTDRNRPQPQQPNPWGNGKLP